MTAPVRIVLLGGGHAHAEVLRRLARKPDPMLRLTLVARESDSLYSGLLAALIRGECTEREAQIDLAALTATANGAALVVAEATGLDLEGRAVLFADRKPVGFDLLSIDVGGDPRTAEGGVGVKPIGRFLERFAAIEAGLHGDGRISVVGAGPGGVELAVALGLRLGGRVALVCETADPLPGAPPHARRIARAALRSAGVELLCGVRAGVLRDGKLALSDGRAVAAAAALWATGVAAPGWLAATGLACDADGSVAVDATLRSLSHPFVFAAGDCAAIKGSERPKAGVWAVRAAAPLERNLRRMAAGRTLRRWTPQRDALVIVGLGHGRALAWRGGLVTSGRLMQRWKQWLDRRWMARFAAGRPF